MDDYRRDHIARFERVRATGDIDGLFVESERDLEGDQPDDSATQ
jgi:hypothetical protein